MTDYTDKTGTKCAMVDECTVNDDVTDIYDLLMTNFLSHYKKNRSPFPIFIHASWLSSHSFTTEGKQAWLLYCYSTDLYLNFFEPIPLFIRAPFYK